MIWEEEKGGEIQKCPVGGLRGRAGGRGGLDDRDVIVRRVGIVAGVVRHLGYLYLEREKKKSAIRKELSTLVTTFLKAPSEATVVPRSKRP